MKSSLKFAGLQLQTNGNIETRIVGYKSFMTFVGSELKMIKYVVEFFI